MEKLLKCSMCNKTFRRQNSLDIHVRIHTGERPFSCLFCPKAFHQQAGLIQHTRVHTGERPYSCSYCMKKFIQKCHLDQHTRLHTGEMPYKCTLCDKTFRQKSNLDQHNAKVHMSSVGLEEILECPFCGKRFARKSYLDRHFKVHIKVKKKVNSNNVSDQEKCSISQPFIDKTDNRPHSSNTDNADEKYPSSKLSNPVSKNNTVIHSFSELSCVENFDAIVTLEVERDNLVSLSHEKVKH